MTYARRADRLPRVDRRRLERFPARYRPRATRAARIVPAFPTLPEHVQRAQYSPRRAPRCANKTKTGFRSRRTKDVATQRIDRNRVTFHLLALPKGVKGSRGAGFLGHEPAGIYAKSASKTFLCTAKGAIALGNAEAGAPVGPEPIFPGTLWTGKQKTPQAVVWTVRGTQASGSTLPAPGFTSSQATAADGHCVVGTGNSSGDSPSRALLWTGNGQPALLADPRDPQANTSAYAVSGNAQGGSSGGMAAGACLWQGSTESFVSLHPKGVDASCVRGVSDDEQVGEFEPAVDTGAPKRAALWRGSADSLVDLTPEGAAVAVATACAAGFQAGWLEEAPRSQRYRAWLWAGSATGSLDLHAITGGEWTASLIQNAIAHENRLLLLGTVEKRQQSGGYNTLIAEQACWWEYRLG